jgi:hypothetical protein
LKMLDDLLGTQHHAIMHRLTHRGLR